MVERLVDRLAKGEGYGATTVAPGTSSDACGGYARRRRP
jgi:hypothetical protein